MASNSQRPSKAERTASAREQAQKMHAAQEAADKRKSLFIKLGVLVAVLAVVALVVALVLQKNSGTVADTGAVPKGGNAAGGITLTSDKTLADTSGLTVDINKVGTAPAEGATPTPREYKAAPKGDPINLLLYVDVNCVHCADFETEYADQISTWLAAGDVTVEYRTVAFLDGASPTNYSSRGANALACVADAAPASYLPFSKAVFAHYPEGEMKNKQLIQLAKDNGADVASCINDGTFRPFAKFTDAAARVDAIGGTPSVFVQDKPWDPNAEPDFAAVVDAAIKANK
ncbi:DsbA family protein [Paeniglutamicibacter psychrophenolicus]|uniref:DsbA family protein n=1 Tax=Paeniglutamicibacter psychrophenolicus TaxID=257454 RepID=UPI002785DFFF|nr:thioredoxin domain-containing protein [Paeniglutamicibacter psychrophenolicus]MDQ0092157.1 protein-disulfide isomerase [Paeniglutamicibacter psychrophenolicus]